MPALYPPLEGYLGARLRSIHQSLLDFESGAARLPDELAALVGELRHELDAVIVRYESQLAEAGDDADLRSRVDARYLAFANHAAWYADVLTSGTDPELVPADVHALLSEGFGVRPPGHVIVLRSVPNWTLETYQLWRPEQMRPGTALLERLRAGDAEREPWLVSVFDIPRSLRRATLSHLLILSHELPHAQDAVADLAHRESILAQIQLPEGSEVDDLASRLVIAWVDEVFADLASVRRFGPAAVLVFAEYARLVQAYGYDIPRLLWQRDFEKHPPAEVRLHFMFRALAGGGFSAAELGELEAALARWRAIADLGAALPSDARPAFVAADALLRTAYTHVEAEAASLVPPHEAYTTAGLARAARLAEDLAKGVARSDELDGQLRSQPVHVADLFNAAAHVRWVPRLLDKLIATMGLERDESLTVEQRRALALGQLDDLLARAIEGQRIGRLWPPELDT